MSAINEKLVVGRFFYRHDGPNGERRLCRHTNRELAQHITCRMPEKMSDLVGRRVVFDSSGPGTGRVVYNVTRIDNEGIWGTLISNTVRELTPADVY